MQALHRGRLRPDDRLRADQRGEGLVPLPRQEQPLEVLPKAPPLGQRAEQGIERGREALQRTRGRGTGEPLAHHDTSDFPARKARARTHKLRLGVVTSRW